MSNKIVYLVSGAGRGLGFGLVKAIAARPNTIVFAGVRNPDGAKELVAFAAEHHDSVFVVKLTSADKEDNQQATKFIAEKAGKLDIVIANAGTSLPSLHIRTSIMSLGEVVSTPVSIFEEGFRINSLGPLVLFQKTHHLLAKSTKPSFVIISSSVGSLAGPMYGPQTVYGMSKAAASFIMKGIHLEHAKEGLVAFSIHPGFVATDLGNGIAPSVGMPTAPVSIEESSEVVLGHIDTRERGGQFVNWKSANEHPWDIEGATISW